MQNLTMYVLAASTLGTVRDHANARNLTPPAFTREFGATLKLRLFAQPEDEAPYPIAQLQDIDSWQCVWDKDYAATTPPIIVADSDDIQLHSVTDTINGVERTFTELVIPVSQMNTDRIAQFLGDAEYKDGLVMEIVGYNADSEAVFGLQIKNFTIRNRVFLGTLSA